VPEAPRLLRVENIHISETPIAGTLRVGANLFDLAGRVHPTPAVAGAPARRGSPGSPSAKRSCAGWYGRRRLSTHPAAASCARGCAPRWCAGEARLYAERASSPRRIRKRNSSRHASSCARCWCRCWSFEMRSLDAGNSAAAAPNRNFAFAAALVEELQRAGVRHACVCPGSRSSPLAVAIARAHGLRAWTHVDERAAAFFALGLAKAERSPVVLVCTSGTAAANFLPAVVEAHHARVPLLVLTSDRPHELRDFGAPQTIDQVRLYGSHVRWFAEAAIPEPGEASLRYARALACRAVAEANGATPGRTPEPAVPRPLDPRVVAGDAFRLSLRSRLAPAAAPYTRVQPAHAVPDAEEVSELAELAHYTRGVIACGRSISTRERSMRSSSSVSPRAGRSSPSRRRSSARAPTTIRARCSPRGPAARPPPSPLHRAPDVVLRVGPMPTGKAFRQWIEGTRRSISSSSIRVRSGRIRVTRQKLDAARRSGAARQRVAASSVRRSQRGARRVGSALARGEQAARSVLAEELSTATALGVPALAQALAAALPDDALLYVASSMAVRDIDLYWPLGTRRLRVLCNRGANGIDGLVSSALGAAAAHPGPCVLLTGDLAFLHDVGGLLAAHRHRLGHRRGRERRRRRDLLAAADRRVR
jgi:2-succinyl-5-enolpyruvyl-6-hydroxy-3-cyclohexene-1-carboxylate synthase